MYEAHTSYVVPWCLYPACFPCFAAHSLAFRQTLIPCTLGIVEGKHYKSFLPQVGPCYTRPPVPPQDGYPQYCSQEAEPEGGGNVYTDDLGDLDNMGLDNANFRPSPAPSSPLQP